MKRSLKKQRWVRALAFALTLVMMLVPMSSCADSAADQICVLRCEEETLPLYFYEFLLSRMKGSLARSKYNVESAAFWAEPIDESGVTYEEYFNGSILDSCKNYLAAAVLFEREGLRLSSSVLAEIDEEIAFYISYDGNDSEKALDGILSPYGVDHKTLRDCYVLEAKYETLLASLYGGGALISDAVKESYYRENYLRFKQILLPKYYYEYERDEQGNMIYFDVEEGKPLYDSENGVYVYDEKGNRIKDSYGSTIYYDAEGNILYDKVNGQPSVVLDENGEGRIHYLSEEEQAALKESAESLVASLGKNNFSAFESERAKHTTVEGAEDAYPDGYYLSSIERGGYEDYMSAILDRLTEMEVGEIAAVESEYGWHVIMKYELDSGKYGDGEYDEWFAGFNSSLINRLFLDKCKSVLPEITVHEENLAKARSIKDIGINFDY